MYKRIPPANFVAVIKLQFALRTVLQYEEDPTVGKNIAQLGEFAVALSRGEIDAENVDNVIANLDKLGLIPWDKTQVRRTFFIHIYTTAVNVSLLRRR